MLAILSCNNAYKGIGSEIKDLGLKSEFVMLNDKQKDLVIHFLEEQLTK